MYVACYRHDRKMDPEHGFFQHYFTSYRRTLPRRIAATTFGLWSRSSLSKSARNSARSSCESLPPRGRITMEPPSTPPTNGHTNETPPVEPTVSFDPEVFRTYLLALLPPVIGATLAELDSLFDDEFNDRVARFSSEGGGVVYVVKAKDEVEGTYSMYSLCQFL